MRPRAQRDQRLVQKTARDFATRVIAAAGRRDRQERALPARDPARGWRSSGSWRSTCPRSSAGAGAGVVAYALAMQEVARACASTAVTMAVTNMVGEVIARFGTDAQQKRCTARSSRAASTRPRRFALSEPDAGSDPGGDAHDRARATASDWVIDGAKQWITSGAHAGVFVVWARTGDRATHPGARGISCFLVEGRRAGPQGRAAPRTRWASAARTPCRSSSTACRVPGERAPRRARTAASRSR